MRWPPKHWRQKLLLLIGWSSVFFHLYRVNNSEKHDVLSKPISHTHKSSPNKVLNDSRVNVWSEAKNLSTMRKFPNVSRIPEPGELTPKERNEIMDLINISNVEQRIYNAETFGPLTKETFVFVIQVHFRFEYLELLIESLANVQGIHDSLIIFSHDVYSPEMNAAIQQINFARVLQIFFPITRQTRPKLYPGKTLGSGHTKMESRTLAKHHWWWKANFVFNQVNVLKEYEGVIHFFEEDLYVIPDYIAVMKKLEVRMKENDCLGCNVLMAGHKFNGASIRKSWKKGKHNVAIVSDLYFPTMNRGFAFNRTLWKKIKACEKTFCDTFKEINFDYSLIEVSMSCVKLTVLAPEATRLFHTGDCGMHFRKHKVCNPLPRVATIKKYIKQFENALFPQNISLSSEFINKTGQRLKEYSGWDKKDSKLCFRLGLLGTNAQVPDYFNSPYNAVKSLLEQYRTVRMEEVV